MDKFEVVLASQTLKFYKSCPLELAEKLNKCFESLENNPFFGPHIKLLQSTEKLYRYRIGEYRVVYRVNKIEKRVIVVLISLRHSAYRDI